MLGLSQQFYILGVKCVFNIELCKTYSSSICAVGVLNCPPLPCFSALVKVFKCQGWWSFALSFEGELKTLLPLDREVRPAFELTVRAQDGGGLACQVAVAIAVADVNDNPPRFTPDAHHFSVAENMEPGTYVAQMQAVDLDTGRWHRLKLWKATVYPHAVPAI